MALFKHFRGNRASLEAQPLHDGYAYFCIDDGTFHIDCTDADGVLLRKQINAKNAETLCGVSLEELKAQIISTVPTKVSAFENDSKYITESAINGKYSEGLAYRLKTDGTYEVSGVGTCTDTDIVIPVIIEGKRVTSIGNSAFQDCTSLTSITIPNSVTTIGNSAFSGCTALTSITIPDSVTSIGNYALRKCTALTHVVISECVTSINGMFYGCSSLMSITIPDSVTTIGVNTFMDCNGLTNITIPDSVTSIGAYAFYDCSSLTSVTIPDSVTSIGDYAFAYCDSLTSITIPDSVTSIAEYAFASCSSLTNITIPSSVAIIGDRAFGWCNNAIIYCEAESQPDGWDANWNYSNRPVVWGAALDFAGVNEKLADKVDKVEGKGLSTNDFTDEYKEHVERAAGIYYSEGLNYILKDNGEYRVAGLGTCTDTDIVIPPVYNGIAITTVGDWAFSGRSQLTSIIIPSSIVDIQARAFNGCSNLTEVTIGTGVTSIGVGAFSGCGKLTNIIIPDSVTSIDSSAFENCDSLTSVVIPDSVVSMEGSIFYNTNNVTVYCEASSKPEGWASNWNNSNRPVVWSAAIDFASVNDKLAGIAAGAEVNVQSDWNVTDTTSDAYIKNKPTIPTVPETLKNPNALTVKGDGTTSFIYDGSAAKTLNIKAGTNINISADTSGNVTINGNTLSAAAGANIGSVGTPSVTASTSNGVTTFTFNNLKGATGGKGDKGDPGGKGDKGDPGYTPVRGTDYWTEADKAEIQTYVNNAILGGTW